MISRSLLLAMALGVIACGKAGSDHVAGDAAPPAVDAVVVRDAVHDAETSDLPAPSDGTVSTLAPFPATGALMGAFINGTTSTPAEVAALLGRPLALEMDYFCWTCDLLTTKNGWVSAVLARGAIPEVSWQLEAAPPCTGPSLDDVISGSQDAIIRAAAQGLRSLAPRWVLLRPWWEMNGSWYCTNEKHQSSPNTCDGTSKFVKAWRHMHDVFVAGGVTNVRWVWSPSHHGTPAEACNDWSLYYPGDDVVDVVAVDGYNKFLGDATPGPGGTAGVWTNFADLFTEIYSHYPTKPFIVGETGSSEDPAMVGRKAQWIADMQAYIKTSMPRLKAIVWFDKKPEPPMHPETYQFDSSPSAAAALRALATDLYFSAP